MFPKRWAVQDRSENSLVARIDEGDGPFLVEATRVPGGWSTNVTRVAGGQRHRLATLVRRELEDAVDAADRIVLRSRDCC
jgi:autonomous glycyl radical cofactor GrcA